MDDDERQASDDRTVALGILGLFGFGMFMFTWVAFDEVSKAKEPGLEEWASVAFPLLATTGIAWVAYRIVTGPTRRARAAAAPSVAPSGQSEPLIRRGFSTEFLITTGLAVIGLAISAIAVWWT